MLTLIRFSRRADAFSEEKSSRFAGSGARQVQELREVRFLVTALHCFPALDGCLD